MKKYKSYIIKNIKFIKKSKSKNDVIYYWAKVDKKLKRISKEYFFELKSHGIKVVLINTNIVKKIKCRGVVKKGFQCSRLVLVDDKLCFQHKKQIILDNTCHTISKKLNQFYTTANNVTVCMQIYKKFIAINKDKDIIIEPSAGSGAFINSINKSCNNKIFIDIDPKHKDIQMGNFLEFNMALEKFKKVHIIGNPPFNVITKFIKKASEVSDVIGFILPLSFLKESRKKIFPLNFHCVYKHTLLNNEFYFNNSVHKIPTIFQIWEKREYNRSLPSKVISNYITFVKKKNSPTLSFRRVGSKCGEISSVIEDKSESTHYFIKFKNGLTKAKFFAIFKKINFFQKNTVAQKSVSQQELLTELKKYGL